MRKEESLLASIMENQMVQIEQIETLLNRQLAWIAAADSRLSLIVPLSTAMLGALAVYAPLPSQWDLSCGIPASFALFFLCVCVIFSAFAFFPRTTGTKGSSIYFEGITSRSLEQYQSRLDSLDEGGYRSDLVEQCYINAGIASTKFAWVKRAMASLFVSMLPWAYAIYRFYGMSDGSL